MAGRVGVQGGSCALCSARGRNGGPESTLKRRRNRLERSQGVAEDQVMRLDRLARGGIIAPGSELSRKWRRAASCRDERLAAPRDSSNRLARQRPEFTFRVGARWSTGDRPGWPIAREVKQVARESITTERPAAGEPCDPVALSRRQFLKKAGATAALIAPGALLGSVFRGAPTSTDAAGQIPLAERDELRERFRARADAALKPARSSGDLAAGRMSDAKVAELADPTGQRASKLQANIPVRTAVGGTPASASAPAAAENILVRMQQDLQRALQKPVEQRRWVMAIDLRKCIGCSACTVACKAENKLPPGVVYRPVMEEEIGTYPHVARRFIPRPCMQCDNPPCVPVCPVGATYKRPDGIVEINYEVCIGCRYCIAACPYGARTFDFGQAYTEGTPQLEPYERQPSPEYGRAWPRENGRSPVGNVRKCQFCLHRLAEGMLPACTTTCVGAATYFGDANDPASLVADLINRPNVVRLKEELGTQPKVYYLV